MPAVDLRGASHTGVHESIDRRALFAGVFAVGAMFALPPTARAQDPVSMLEAAAEVAGCLKEIFTGWGGGGNDEAAALQRIDAKLDGVVHSQQVILNDLADLKIAVKNLIQDTDLHDLNAEKVTYSGLLATMSSNRRSDYADLQHRLQDTCGRLGQDKFVAFTAYASGVAMLVSVARLRGFSEPDLRALRLNYLPAVKTWLDPANPDSLTSLVNTTAQQIEDGKRAIASASRRIDRGGRGSTLGPQACTWEEWLDISGDIDTPISGVLETPQKDCHTIPVYKFPIHNADVHPNGNHAQNVGLGVLANQPIQRSVAADVAAAQAQLPKPQGVTSEFDEVRTLIVQRNATLALMSNQIAYQALQASMQAAADALAA
ncbi:MAG: hypothetical protein E7812_05050 [Phenylobacterium sp.]|nr:MAG: hypothetical protein E7812_05050 [Phenylobacterium sp.]